MEQPEKAVADGFSEGCGPAGDSYGGREDKGDPQLQPAAWTCVDPRSTAAWTCVDCAARGFLPMRAAELEANGFFSASICIIQIYSNTSLFINTRLSPLATELHLSQTLEAVGSNCLVGTVFTFFYSISL